MLYCIDSLLIIHQKSRFEMTEDQRQEVEEAFHLFDADKVGSIDYHELKVAIRALGFPITKEEVLRAASEVDFEATGRVNLAQFSAICKRLPQQQTVNGSILVTHKMRERDPEEEILKAFHLFDTDNTGKISVKVLINLARTVMTSCRICEV